MNETFKKIFGGANVKVTSPFGERPDPFTGKASLHNGTDMYAIGKKNASVYALEEGTVLYAKDETDGSAWGARVYIHYPRLGVVIQYAHLDKIYVRTGDSVNNTTHVANIGKTGKVTGIHLHLGMTPFEDWDKPFASKRWLNPEELDALIKSKEVVVPVPKPVPTPTPVVNKFKVGDKVLITGKGNGSAYGNSNISGGIGWYRYITAIHTGRRFPYQVGNYGKTDVKNTTGFYTEGSLRKVV